MKPTNLVEAPVDFVLVTALDEERVALLAKLPDCKQLPPEPQDIRRYYSGRLPVTFPGGTQGHYSIVVMQLLGMGRVQAATATGDAIKRWRPRYVIMVGIAGGVAAKHVQLGDILVSQQVVDYELQKLTPNGPDIRWQVHQADPRLLGACQQMPAEAALPLLTVPRPLKGAPQRLIGPIASGDKVIAYGAAFKQYRQHWAALIGVEMEAAGVAAAAFQSAKPPGFFMVRGVSDFADDGKDSKTVQKWRPYACDIAAAYTVALLQSGPVPLKSGSRTKKTKRISDSDSLLRPHLEALIETCAPLRLKAIDQAAMRTDRKPLGLTSVYVDLNLDLRIPKKLAFPDYLKKLQSAREPAREAMQPDRGETRLVPVLEALAHYPKMVLLGRPGSGKSTLSTYLALSLAEAALGDAAALKRLGRWWKHGPLLPVPVTLREFAATLPADLDRGRAKHLWDFIAADLANSGRGTGFGETLRKFAEDRGALFLLDGLDEAGDESRRARVLEAVDEFTRNAGAKCRFLLTSRPYAWEESTAPADAAAAKTPPPQLQSLPPAYRLADFEPEQIQEFIQHWYHAIAVLGWIGTGEAKEKTTNLLGAVQREDLAALARNPLLLTLMATLHSNRTRLPDDRADLYNEVVELLLQRWNETIRADRGLLDALKIPSLKLGNLRETIEQLAFESHAANVGKEGTADIAEGDLLKGFSPLLGGSNDKAALVVAYIEKRAGLLLGQGPRERQRQFTFPHRTFQEYLAACYLARQPDFRTRAVDLARANPAHWREVLTLAARKASADTGVPVADALVHCERFEVWSQKQAPTETDWRVAMLAAEQLLEIGLASITSREEHNAVRDRVAGWLVALVEKEGLPARDRANAGNALARLGDPRPGVGLDEKEKLPKMEWTKELRAGDFTLAENKQTVRIERPYQISRYLVTVRQFQAFVDAKGYEQDRFWSAPGRAWRDGKAELKDLSEWHRDEYRKLNFPIRGPEDYIPVFQTPNHPRVGVSWYEATAFCAWLAEKLKLEIRLPREAEWEQAARWNKQLGKADNRRFPWGDAEKDVAQRCNMSDTGIDHTSTVGLFPGGNAECGATDMSGNVWEWCENWYDDKDKSARVLRGGSFYHDPDSLRCGYRDINHPDLRNYYIGFRVVCVDASAR
jgi:formylglycine-generating enzyme required for sulfatase activity/nucleoside phosphorylase